MPSHSEKRTLPFAPRQVFDLVADVEKYPDFLPWCVGTRINARRENGFNADVLIGYGGLRESFNSDVILTPHDRIDIQYQSGPFAHLSNLWHFKAVAMPAVEGTCALVGLDKRPDVMNFASGPACEIEFFIDFAFRTSMLNALIEGFFTQAVTHMVDAFEKRAAAIYGANNSTPD